MFSKYIYIYRERERERERADSHIQFCLVARDNINLVDTIT